ncbi:MAG: hypothetical protein PHS19_01265 [Eubacteriales bacterium]|nr:hypothetical protein [Eubacteriales bacterium]
MAKKTALLAIIFILVFTLAGCGSPIPERLVGEWKCDDRSTGNYVDTSFYALSIEDSGNFNLYDFETGNPGISGTMEGDDTGKIGILQLNCDKEEFNPPLCWPNLKTDSRIRYRIMDENTFRLGYVGIWMTFRK